MATRESASRNSGKRKEVATGTNKMWLTVRCPIPSAGGKRAFLITKVAADRGSDRKRSWKKKEPRWKGVWMKTESGASGSTRSFGTAGVLFRKKCACPHRIRGEISRTIATEKFSACVSSKRRRPFLSQRTQTIGGRGNPPSYTQIYNKTTEPSLFAEERRKIQNAPGAEPTHDNPRIISGEGSHHFALRCKGEEVSDQGNCSKERRLPHHGEKNCSLRPTRRSSLLRTSRRHSARRQGERGLKTKERRTEEQLFESAHGGKAMLSGMGESRSQGKKKARALDKRGCDIVGTGGLFVDEGELRNVGRRHPKPVTKKGNITRKSHPIRGGTNTRL